MKIATTHLKAFVLLLLALPFHSFAIHNRAGEIHVEYVDDLTRRATIITYTKTGSIPGDRRELGIHWGDGKIDTVQRSNNKGELLSGDTKKNIYIIMHRYARYGNYTISMQDPNRNAGQLNVNFPQSDAIAFYIQTSFTLAASLKNSTPKLLNAPIDKGVVGMPFKHLINAFDIDGDSIAYRLAVPLQDFENPAPLYEFPDKIKAGNNNKISFNEKTGEFIWNSPQQKGEYTIALKIISYRNGVPIDTTVRDMQIYVDIVVSPVLPEIVTVIPTLTDVKAGQEVFLILKSKIGQSPEGVNAAKAYKITATGGAFEVPNNKAEFNNQKGYQTAISDTFRWKVTEQHARKLPYMVVFKIEDNTFDSSGLVNFYMLEIKVNSLASKIQELDNQALTAYPNPSQDAVTLNFEKENETVLLNVFDVTGRTVFSTTVKNQNVFSLKKEEIGKGVFWVRAYFEKSNTVGMKKIIFQ
jgi:Secretion system C-terminal sorting domain